MFVHRVHVVKCEKNGNGKICSRVIEQAALQVGHSQVCSRPEQTLMRILGLGPPLTCNADEGNQPPCCLGRPMLLPPAAPTRGNRQLVNSSGR